VALEQPPGTTKSPTQHPVCWNYPCRP